MIENYNYTFQAVYADLREETIKFSGAAGDKIYMARLCAGHLQDRHNQDPKAEVPIGFQFEWQGKIAKFNFSIQPLPTHSS